MFLSNSIISIVRDEPIKAMKTLVIVFTSTVLGEFVKESKSVPKLFKAKCSEVLSSQKNCKSILF